jgi:hypothetical protein
MRCALNMLFFLTLISSCQDRQNIKLTGKVVDDVTNEPIQGADIVALCWYNHSVDDESFRKVSITTDKFGNFTSTFPNGNRIDIASQANGFLPTKKSIKIETNEIKTVLRLRRDVRNETLISHVISQDDIVNPTNKTPLLRLRIQNNNTETYGFDFKGLTSDVDTLNSDLWLRIEREQIALVTPNSSGLIPILRSEIKSSLFYELEKAPITGYRRKYILTGGEEGFFIRCRGGKTFAKVILVKGTVDISGEDKRGSFKERRRYFSFLFQPNESNDLTFPKAKIDLERFLVDFKYK